MYKYKCILVLLVAVLLNSCGEKPLPEYLAKEQLRKEFIASSNASCPLGYLDNNSDIIAGQIYFKDGITDLTKEDKEAIKKVSNMHASCPKTILLVGHASNKESENDIVTGAILSFVRVNETSQEFLHDKVTAGYINVLFCGISNNLVDEKDLQNNNANLYNQRVDIVFLNNSVENYRYGCITSKQ